MKILGLFVLSVLTAGFTFVGLNEKTIFKFPATKPYESNFYADDAGPTPTKVAHAFLLGLLYDAPPMSR